MTGRGALALRRARRHLGRVPRRVEREARERSTGGVVRSGAQVLLRDRDTRPLVVISSARTVRRTVRGERPFIMSFAAPPPSSSAPKAHAHPPVSPATERDTAAEASADARGVLKVRPHPPRPRRSPTRHPFIVGKEKNARPSGRHTAWSLPSDDPSR